MVGSVGVKQNITSSPKQSSLVSQSETSAVASLDSFRPATIQTPFGKLVPSAPEPAQLELDLGLEKPDAAIALPLAGNEIHGNITPKLNFSTLNLDESGPLRNEAILRTVREAKDNCVGAVTVLPSQMGIVRQELGENSILRVQAFIDGSLGDKLEQIRQSRSEGVDELAIRPNYNTLVSGRSDEFLKELQTLVAAAGKVPVKMVLDLDRLSDSQVADSCKLAEQAGCRFIRTQQNTVSPYGELFDPGRRTLGQSARLVAESCSLGVELASDVDSLADCQLANELLKGRRVRFESGLTDRIVAQERAELRGSMDFEQAKLNEEMQTDAGRSSLVEREKLLQHFVAKIDQAHAEGKPVVYLSVPVRGNDAANFEQNVAAHNALVQTAADAGVAYVDPFEVEGTPILTNKGISHRAIQELLMDPATGMWPQVLGRCDAIAHAPNWKFSTGAREEQLMADVWGIPNWDGQGTLSIRNYAQEGVFDLDADR